MAPGRATSHATRRVRRSRRSRSRPAGRRTYRSTATRPTHERFAVAEAARWLVELRGTGGSTRPNGSTGWTSRLPDTRGVPCPGCEDAEKALRKRTLTNLYKRPQWLADEHAVLDAVVAAAYGWPADISDDDALRELPVFNDG